jgi:hypothetical protein
MVCHTGKEQDYGTMLIYGVQDHYVVGIVTQ